MNAMAPTRTTELHECRVRLTTGPAAAAEARRQVRAAISAWDIAADPDVAILLTSELVTNAVTHQPGSPVLLVITCSRGQLRVDVHDTSCSLPVPVDASADAESGRGLMLVATLSAEWGFYRTPAGKAVFFALALGPDRRLCRIFREGHDSLAAGLAGRLRQGWLNRVSGVTGDTGGIWPV